MAISPQLLRCDQNNLQIRDPHQISGGTYVFLKKSMTWHTKSFPGFSAICDFRRFLGIFYGHMY
jgi:hypothetical protein